MAIARGGAWAAGTGKPGDPINLAGITTTGAQLVVVSIGYFPDNAGANTTEVSSVTDSKGNSYSIAGARTVSASGDSIELWYSIVGSAGASHTITVDLEGSTFISVCAAWYNGFTATPVLDQTTGNTGNGTAIDSGNVTIATADELLVGGGTHLHVENAATGFIAGTNFSIAAQYGNSADNATAYIEDRIVAATGTYSAPASVNTGVGGGSGNWAARIATFKANAGGGVTIYNRKIFDSPIFKSRIVSG